MDKEYYVHRKNTFVGNAPSWWAKGGNGYTSYILGAERFSGDEAFKLYESDPNKWEIFNCEEVDKRLHLVFDMQDKQRLGTDAPCSWPSGYAYNPNEITALRARVAELEKDVTRLDWLIRYARTVEWFDIDLVNPKAGRESLRDDIDKSMRLQNQK